MNLDVPLELVAVLRPPVGVAVLNERPLGVEARAVPAAHLVLLLQLVVGQVAEELPRCVRASFVGELVGLQHVFQEVCCGEGELGRYRGHGVIRATEQERHGGVELLQFLVVLGVIAPEHP